MSVLITGLMLDHGRGAGVPNGYDGKSQSQSTEELEMEMETL